MKKHSLIYSVFLVVIAFLCTNFTGGTDKETSTQPEYVELLEGEGSFYGIIYDDRNEIPVKEISFTGHSKIGGIRKEDDDSVNVLDLSKLKVIEIVKENYISKKYQDREYILAKTISNNGAVTKGLLIPININICAIAIKTDMPKAWRLRKINKIVIKKSISEVRRETYTQAIAEEQKKEETEGIVSKIKKGFKKVSEAIAVK